MPKYLSGRVKRTPQNKLTDDRYQYLDLGQAEPNIGDPPTATGTPGIPAGQQYQLVSVLSHPGERYWIPIGGGLIPGAISVYEEGSLVGGVSSITQLNFVGNSLTAVAAPWVDGVSAGNIATITAAPPGPDTSVLFKESGDFATSTDLVFNTAVGILTVGNGINIGIGGTIITANASSGIASVGINEANPTQELDVNGDVRIRGTIYDWNNEGGDQGELIVKGLYGLEWTNANAVRSGAGGEIGQVQYHNTAGLVDGADIFYYDAVNDRVGIGSTQPAQVLDVLGVSTFIGGVTVDHLYITGITTALNLINADGGIKANTAQVTDLTNDRVVFVGPFGELQDNSNFTFDDYTLGVNGINVGGCTTTSQLEATGVSTLGNIKIDTNTVTTTTGNLTLDSLGGTVQVNDKLYLNNNTQSTTKSTGALTIGGGVGILLDVNVGGAVSFKGNSDPTGVAVTLAAAGGITTTGGDLYVGGELHIKEDTVFSDGKFEQLLVNPGIATFRGDVEFWSNADTAKIAYWDKSEDALRFNDGAKIKIGNSDDLQLYHSSNINYINNNVSTGELRIVGGSHNLAKFTNGVSVDLYYDSANYTDPKLQTSGIGVTVNGQLDATNGNFSGSLTVTSTSNLNGDVNLGNDLIDNIVFGGKVDSHILPNVSDTYNLGSGANRWDTVYARTFDGLGTLTVEDLYVSGIATFKDDVEFHGTGGVDSKGNVGIKSAFWDKSEMRFRYLDDIEASWGDNRELQIYHYDNSFIKNTSETGNLYVDSKNEFYIRTEGGLENAIKAKTNEGVDLYYDGSLRLSTYDKGIKLSSNGTNTGAGVSFYDKSNNKFAAIKAPDTLVGTAYTLTLPPDDGGPDNVLKTDGDGILSWVSQGDLTAKPGGENTEFQFNNNGSFDGSVSFVFDETGSLSYGGANSVHFLSLTTAADPARSVIWQAGSGQLILTRDTEIKLGTANMTGSSGIYYTDNGATSHWKATGSGSIELSGDNSSTGTHTIKINPNSGKSSIIATANSSVELYYNNTKRLETTTDGIKISGGIRDKDDQLGSPGYILKTTGTELDWVDPSSVGAEPGGNDTQVQYNNDGSFGGMSNLTYIDSGNNIGNINILDGLGATKVQWKATDDYGGANGLIEFKDDVKLRFGSNSQNIEIYHQQSDNANYFDNSVKLNINIKDELNIKTISGENVIKAVEDGSVTLYYDSFNKLQTTTDGIKIYGGIQDKDGQLGAAGQVLSSTGSALDWIPASDITGGAGGSDRHIQYNQNNSLAGSMYFQFDYDGSYYHNVSNSIYFQGTSINRNVSWQPENDAFVFMNGTKINLGTEGNDNNNWQSQIYHDGTRSYWSAEQGGKDIWIQGKPDNTSSQTFKIRPNKLKESIVAVANGKVELYYNETKRVETNNTGLYVYGDLNVLGGIVDTVGSVGTNTQVLTSTGARFKWVNSSDVGGGGTPAGPDHAIQFNDNGSFGGTANFTYNGNDVYFGGNNANIWFNQSLDEFVFDDGARASFGTSRDFLIYHHSSTSTSKIEDVEGNDILISGKDTSGSGSQKIQINAESGKVSIIATANSSVELYHNNGKVLETSSEGIGVYGSSAIGAGIDFYEGSDNGSDKILIKSPNTLGASYTLTLPPNDGGSNEVLTTDGNGILSWTAKGSGGTGVNADTLKTTKSTADSTHYLTFVDSNNDPGAYENVLTGAGITFNPSNSDLSVDGRLYLNGVDNNFQGSIWSKGGLDKKFVIGNDSTEAETYLVVANSSNTQIGIATFKCSTADGDKSYFRSDVSVPVNESYNLGDSITQRWDNVYAKTYHGEVLKLYDSDKSHKITFQTPATTDLIADYTLTLPENDGGNDEVLTTDGNGVLSWTAKGGGGSATPGGSDTEVQYNNGGTAFGGMNNLTYNDTSGDITIGGDSYNAVWDKSANALEFQDHASARFGDSEDLRIYHSSNNSYIDESVGNDLYIRGKDSGSSYSTTNKIWINAEANRASIVATANSSVELYHSTTSSSFGKALETNSRGIGVFNTNTNLGGELSIFDAVGAGNNLQYISLKAPNALAASYTLTLPQNDGGNNEVLTTDGNGVLSWTTKGGGSSGITNVAVDYTDRTGTCSTPITVTGTSTKTINIPDTSNADGHKYVQSSEPTGNTVCDGDIWYDTTPPSSSGNVGGNVPVGGIIMYSGTETELNALTNWKICDGNNGTPNLKDKFIIGADQYSSGWKTNVTGSLTQNGGSKDAVVVSHTHTQSGGGSNDDGGPRVPGGNSTGTMTNISTTGVSGTNQNLPPYYALAYIMRVS